MIELLTLEVDLCTAIECSQPLGEVQRAGSTDEFGLETIQFGQKTGLGHGRIECLFQFQNQWHERFCDEATAERAKLSLGVGALTETRSSCLH